MKNRVFCNQCKWIYTHFGNLDCIYPVNKKKYYTFLCEFENCIDKPEKLNKNNDCKWFEKK